MVHSIRLPMVAATMLVLASFAPGFAGESRADSLLVNGNFEDGPVLQAGFFVYSVPPGDPSLTGWTVSDGAINIVTDNYWVPPFGHRSVQLSSTGPGSIQQTFATTPGATYRLTFWIAGEPASSPQIKHLQVGAAAAAREFLFDSKPAWTWDEPRWRARGRESICGIFVTGCS